MAHTLGLRFLALAALFGSIAAVSEAVRTTVGW